MWLRHKPSADVMRAFLARAGDAPFSYDQVGASRGDARRPPPGYQFDHNRRRLGQGRAAFEAACEALRRWEMFQLGWVEPGDPTAPLTPRTTVAVLARAGGLWSLNACRIVYAVDEAAPIRTFGFAYGTLPDHAERGEERFTIEWREDDGVWYDLRAFSRPNRWYTWVGYPMVRHLQKRFAADSLEAMARAVAKT